MSRLFLGMGLLMMDTVTTVMALLSSTNLLLICATTLVTSIFLTLFSATVRSVFWPSYFWDQPEEA